MPDRSVSHGQQRVPKRALRFPLAPIAAGQVANYAHRLGDSQAQSASSILVTRSMQEPQTSGQGLFVVWTTSGVPHQIRTRRPLISLLASGPHEVVQTVRSLLLSLKIRVLLDQRGLLRRLAGPNHRVLERGAGPGRQGVPGVTRALRHFRPKVERRNGFPFSPTNRSPSCPFSAYRSR